MNRLMHQVLCAVFVFLLLFLSWTVGLTNDKAGKIDAYLAVCYNNGQFNGTALVAEGGTVIFKKGYGYANKEWQVANGIDTKFRIGSITKQFAAMLIMQLVEEGKIGVEAKMTDYLQRYRRPGHDSPSLNTYLRYPCLHGIARLLVGFHPQSLQR